MSRQRKQFRLTRTLPDGTVKTHSMVFPRVRDAATAVAFSLYDNGAASKVDAQRFAALLVAAPLGQAVRHEPSGYAFRIDPDGDPK